MVKIVMIVEAIVIINARKGTAMYIRNCDFKFGFQGSLARPAPPTLGGYGRSALSFLLFF